MLQTIHWFDGQKRWKICRNTSGKLRFCVFQRQSLLTKAVDVLYKSWQSLLLPCRVRFKERHAMILTKNAKSATQLRRQAEGYLSFLQQTF